MIKLKTSSEFMIQIKNLVLNSKLRFKTSYEFKTNFRFKIIYFYKYFKTNILTNTSNLLLFLGSVSKWFLLLKTYFSNILITVFVNHLVIKRKLRVNQNCPSTASNTSYHTHTPTVHTVYGTDRDQLVNSDQYVCVWQRCANGPTIICQIN